MRSTGAVTGRYRGWEVRDPVPVLSYCLEILSEVSVQVFEQLQTFAVSLLMSAFSRGFHISMQVYNSPQLHSSSVISLSFDIYSMCKIPQYTVE